MGLNGITQTYPNAWEFVVEWLINLTEFPYLDLMIAVTSWNEMAPEFREKMWEQDSSVDWDDVEYSYDKDFYSHIDIGIDVHENTIELLNPPKRFTNVSKVRKTSRKAKNGKNIKPDITKIAILSRLMRLS